MKQTKPILEFFDKIKRERLARRGLSSGKKRRTQEDRHVTESLESSLGLRIGLYGVLALIAGWLVTTVPGGTFEGEMVAGWTVTLVILAAAILIFHFNYPTTSGRSSKTFLVIGGLLAELFLIRGVMAMDPAHEMLVLPVALIPIFHSVLMGQRIGTFSAIFTSILGALLMEPGKAMQFLAFSLVASYTGVLVTRRVKKRGRLLRAGFYVGIVSVLLGVLFGEISVSGLWGGQEACQTCLAQLGMSFGMGLLTGMAVSAVLPILEGVFLVTTEISWLEMSDLNHKLLKRMQLEAPGTFHHSLMVAQLAEAAAEAVGANSSMCRVCAYFHDIGKLKKPLYFVENQSEGNPHDDLTPTMSALVIVAHVKDGVDMAIKEKLAPEIIDVIQEHHGDSLVYYFYRKAQEQQSKEEGEVEDGQISDEEVVEVDRKNFSYPGPVPQSRESGIISLADAVESASRSLEKPNPTKIRTLVDDIVLGRIKDGQLDDCGLTLNDVKVIREVFSKTLRSMLHTRIAYPEEKKKKAKKSAKKEGSKTKSKDEAKNVVPVEELERQRKAGGK
ncbi:MAG: HDIG domain-containing metalloprotein [Roseibacillus sp.]